MLGRLGLATGIGVLAVLACAACAGNDAYASTYVVAPAGKDSGSGTVASPWRSIKKGMEALRPGDVLLVRGGTYTEEVTGLDLRKGTPSARLTVKAYPGERPVLRGVIRIFSAEYLTLDGLNVTWDPDRNDEHMIMMIDGVGWRIANAELWGSRGYSALLVGGNAKQWRLDHNFIHDTYATHGEAQDHLVYVAAPISGGVIERNLFANSPNGRGIKLGPSASGSEPIGGVTIRFNTFTDNTGPSNIQLSYGASQNQIYRNIMVRSASGEANVTAYNLNGDDNHVRENIGWASSGVHDRDDGLSGSDNLHLDPQLVNMRPLNPVAQAYGRFAPGDTEDPAFAPGTAPAAGGVAPRPMLRRRAVRVYAVYKRVGKRRRPAARVWVQCGSKCRGNVRLKAKARGSKKKKVVGRKRFRAGQSGRVVRVRLNGRGVRLLRRRGELRVHAVATVRFKNKKGRFKRRTKQRRHAFVARVGPGSAR